MSHRHDHYVFNQRVRRSHLPYAFPMTFASVLGIVLLSQLPSPFACAAVACLGVVVGLGIAACSRGEDR